jgi:hypothetical protein
MADSKVIFLAGAGVVATILLMTKKAAAATDYTCPYCGLTFPTLEALQEHVMAVHPGQRIPISIGWS